MGLSIYQIRIRSDKFGEQKTRLLSYDDLEGAFSRLITGMVDTGYILTKSAKGNEHWVSATLVSPKGNGVLIDYVLVHGKEPHGNAVS